MYSIRAGLLISVLCIFSTVQAEVSPESIVDIFNRLDKLESQSRELRGSNEELKHELQQLKKSQKQGFLNIDSQIEALGSTSVTKPAEKKSQTSKVATPVTKAPEVKKVVVPVTSKKSTAPISPQSSQQPTKTKVAHKKNRQPTRYEKETYKAAFDKIKVSPTAASTAFKEYIKMQPNSPLSANAQYWIGEIMYSHNNYNGAVQEFIKVLQTYKYSDKAPDAAIKLGYSFYALKKWDLARRTFEDVLRFFPENKNVVKLAKKRLEKMKDKGK